MKAVRYLDISIPTGPQTTVFPGDPAPEILWPYWTHEKGNPANVGFFHGGLHHGTHVDAPWHFIAGAKRLQDVPLDRWLGPCWVADLTDESRCVNAAALTAAGIPAATTRLLLKTRNSQTDYWHEPWNPEFIFIDRSAAEWCVHRGIQTIGLDYLTIDSPLEPEFPSHMTLLEHEIVIIENIVLRDVSAGAYELLAAPVNLVDTDGAWCRALLRLES